MLSPMFTSQRRTDPRTPSLIYNHGLAMETEMLNIPDHLYRAWAKFGFRVILPDAPGHNRRVQLGYYGGESFLRCPPYSNLEHFSRIVRELGSWIGWAHDYYGGKVALGGISLGALSTQLTAQYAKDWPSKYRPDALMMTTTTAFIADLGQQSAIARATGLDRVARNWGKEEQAILNRLVDASAEPPLDPEKMVALLGKYDKVTPFLGGITLASRWKIPKSNLFIRRQGHFSAAFGLQYDWAPLRQLFKIVTL